MAVTSRAGLRDEESGRLVVARRPALHRLATLLAAGPHLAEVEGRLEVWADLAALHTDVAADVRRPVTDLLLDALQPAVRTRLDGALVPVVTARTMAGARHGMVRERCSERWPVLAEAGVPVLLLLADEPAEVRERNASAASRMAAALPKLDTRVMAGWGHDLIGDGGPALAREVVRLLTDAAS